MEWRCHGSEIPLKYALQSVINSELYAVVRMSPRMTY